MKNQAFPSSHFSKKNLESAKFTSKKHGKSTLHSLIAKHVLEISIKLKFQCERFEKKQCFAVMVLNWFSFCFCQGLFIRCHLYHTIILYYPETKEMIHESVNLERRCVQPKQNPFSLQFITHCKGFANVELIFYKAHSLSSEQVFN